MAESRRSLTPEDLLDLKLLEDPQMSPDGEAVLYILKEMDRESDEYRRTIWRTNPRGEGARSLTPDTANDAAPRWSPDGRRIAFLSDRNGPVQLWVMTADGEERTQITHVGPEVTIGPPVWSPDGRWLAFQARVGPHGLTPPSASDLPPRERYTQDVKVVERIWWQQNGEGIISGTRIHVFVVDAGGGEPRRLTSGDFDHFHPVWSPDGRWVAVSANRNPDADYRRRKRDLWLFPAAGGEPRRLTDLPGPAAGPSWSPDGRLIAFVGHTDPFGDYSEPRLWVVPVDPAEGRATGLPVLLTAHFDRPVGDVSIDDLRSDTARSTPLVWSDGGSALIFAAGDAGATRLFRIRLRSGGVQPLTPSGEVIFAYSFCRKGERAAMAVTAPTVPCDLVTGTVYPDRPMARRRATELNRGWLERVSLAVPRSFISVSPDGTRVHGWILPPPEDGPHAPPLPGRRPSTHPAVMEIHGGPTVMYGYNFFFEFQMLASHGIAVIYTNPRGSNGYGEAFCAALRGRWGGPDYSDLMAAAETALRRFPLDRARFGVAGGSYGGYMTNWIITQTDRFRAAVAMRSISNRYSDYGTSDSGYLRRDEMGGAPWERPWAYLASSPISYVKQVRTPLLLIQSLGDRRCPPEQAEQFFTALKQTGKTVQMVLYPPEEHHELSRSGLPWHRVDRLERILGWYRRHLR